MPDPCPCCPPPPPTGNTCIDILCRGGTVIELPPTLLCTVVFPPNGGNCCCPAEGVVTFPLNFTIGTFGGPSTPPTPCNQFGPLVTRFFRGNATVCQDLGAIPCFQPPNPFVAFQSDVVLIVCQGPNFGSGAANFLLMFGMGPYASFGWFSGCGTTINNNPCFGPPVGCPTFNDCKFVSANCQAPDPPFNLGLTGYDCADIYLEYTVSTVAPGCETAACKKCGPYKVIIQSPP